MIAKIASECDVPDQYHSQPRHLKIIHVGAGAAGLLTAYKAARNLNNFELICYEKNPTIGGTWLENKYPGCACDIPAHTYTYSFEPNPEWSGFYSYANEIQDYFLRFYEKYKLARYVKFNTKVIEAKWMEKDGEWEVLLEKEGQTFTDRCNVLMNGSGVLSDWKWPNIEGLHSFKGTLAHSADWDTSIDWKDKRVAVIGTGSSSIQMVPHLAKGMDYFHYQETRKNKDVHHDSGSKSVTVFARNVTYIAPQIGSQQEPVDPHGAQPAAAGKHSYIEAEKERFRKDTAFHLAYRKRLESAMNKMFPLFLRGTEINIAAKKGMRESMEKRIGPGHDNLKKNLIPSWSPGCRRLTPGEDYLETLVLDHVKVVHDEIAQITETGITTARGEELEFDIIACATGFNVAYVPRFTIVGVDGIVMQDDWAETPNIYCSIAAPKYPNYFVVNGPTGNWGQGCALPSHEVQIMYILQCVKKMQEDGIRSLEPRQQPTTDINKYIDAWHKKHSVWAEDCRSWYKENKPDGRVYLWPGSMLHHLKTLERPRFEHYDVRYWDDNMWSFLGNGRTELELEHEKGREVDMAPYIRNEDVPWSVSLPA